MSDEDYVVDVREVGRDYYIPSEGTWQSVLHGVSLSIRPGESVGVIGRNGSGKSTLLRLIAGTLRPTRGSVRVPPSGVLLVDLGAGFHADLSLLDNIRVFGSLLDQRQRFLKQTRFILEFSELADRARRPYYTLSAGMAARFGLACALAAKGHIYLIDEALAVGDSEFRVKCLRAFRERKTAGASFVVASHDLDIIEAFCDKSIVLDRGRVVFYGDAHEAVATYAHGL